jgi:hypothetical protein
MLEDGPRNENQKNYQKKSDTMGNSGFRLALSAFHAPSSD